MKTILVLSGVTKIETLNKFPYLPNYVFPSVAEIIPQNLD
jgi:ribonucleotide monophosphatase NagD (HAD superfamily)